MTFEHLPVLYSFRRCPYAMRARLALSVSQQSCVLREIDLKNRPDELYEASPKGTVPGPGTARMANSGQLAAYALETLHYVQARWRISPQNPY